MSDLILDTCAAAIDTFPLGGSSAAQLRATVPYAIQAPSVHNTQPWTFRLSHDCLELWADRTRALPVVDPEDRELVVSCGAALFNVRVTLRRFGRHAHVTELPDPDRPDLLALIRLGDACDASDEDRATFDAIPLRRTYRFPFQDRAVPESVLGALTRAAAAEGAWLKPFQTAKARDELVATVVQGDRYQMADRSFRRELASWVHPSRARSQDGMPGSALGTTALKGTLAPVAIRTFDLGRGRAAWDEDLARRSPVLAVLGTRGDDVIDALRAGQALQRVLLTACAEGIYGSFLNQPIEVPALRDRVRAMVNDGGAPQMILRLGYGHPGARAPRREVGDVFESTA